MRIICLISFIDNTLLSDSGKYFLENASSNVKPERSHTLISKNLFVGKVSSTVKSNSERGIIAFGILATSSGVGFTFNIDSHLFKKKRAVLFWINESQLDTRFDGTCLKSSSLTKFKFSTSFKLMYLKTPSILRIA